MASTFNTDLIEEIHHIISLEARADGSERTFSPHLNIYVDPRFGRIQEGMHSFP